MKKVFDFVKNLSVSWKFVFAYFAILIIPIILTGIYLYKQISDSAIEQARLVMEQNLMQTKASILQKQKVIENISNILAYDTDFINFLDYEYEDENQKLHEFQFNFSPLIENILRQNNTIYAIRIYMDDLVVTEMLDSYYSVSLKKSSQWYEYMLDQKPRDEGWISSHDAILHALKPNHNGQTQVFSYCKVLHTKDYQKKTGMLEIEIKESTLFDMLRDSVIGKLGKVFIVDGNKQIVSNNIHDLYKKDIIMSGFVDYETNKRISKVQKVNNEQAITIAIPVEEIGCSIVGIFPVRNFNNEVKNSLNKIIAVLLISSVMLGLIIYIITNALLGRIRILVKAMKQVRNDNLDVSVQVNVMDEFGELGLSFNHMTRRIHDLVETVYKIKLMEREAELKALEAQVNPHFLYNTLATISWVARKANSQEIVKIANSLAKFYRLVLSKGGTLIDVKDELDMVMSYLHIQKVRFEDKFNVEYKINKNVFNNKVIKNILQPVVENALIYGIEPKRSHGTIIIIADECGNKLIFKIIDDGVGMNRVMLDQLRNGRLERSKGSGYAIKNIMERLKAYYGQNYMFDIFSKPGIGTAITISVDKSCNMQF